MDLAGANLEDAERVVIVIHGMSTTVETMKEGFPVVADGSLTKVYWRLPVLREGAEAVRLRRDTDLFRQLFLPVVQESRRELRDVIDAVGEVPVGLFGFSIGSLIALWGAVDNPSVEAVATVGGVSDLRYLQHYYPDYDWDQSDVTAALRATDVSTRMDALQAVPILMMHGVADTVARWEWVQDFADQLARCSQTAAVQRFSHVQHRLQGEDWAEVQQLSTIRRLADSWFTTHLGSTAPLRRERVSARDSS